MTCPCRHDFLGVNGVDLRVVPIYESHMDRLKPLYPPYKSPQTTLYMDTIICGLLGI
jgi:hypothetical protein